MQQLLRLEEGLLRQFRFDLKDRSVNRSDILETTNRANERSSLFGIQTSFEGDEEPTKLTQESSREEACQLSV